MPHVEIEIEPLSAAQHARLRNEHPVRVRHGHGHKIVVAHDSAKKILQAHRKGKAHTLTLDPLAAQIHREKTLGGKLNIGHAIKKFARGKTGREIIGQAKAMGKQLLREGIAAAQVAASPYVSPEVAAQLGSMADEQVEGLGLRRYIPRVRGGKINVGHALKKFAKGKTGREIIGQAKAMGKKLLHEGIAAAQVAASPYVSPEIAAQLGSMADEQVEGLGFRRIAKRGCGSGALFPAGAGFY